jgi:hypothetical protein
MKRIAIIAGSLLLLGSTGGALAWTADGRRSTEDRPPTAEVVTPSESSQDAHVSGPRTVLVANEPELGTNDGSLTVGYERGTKPPSSETDAVVVTDENCTPDAKGVSHCRNEIRMASGKTVRVQHDHRMHEVPCLVPGEKVRLRSA